MRIVQHLVVSKKEWQWPHWNIISKLSAVNWFVNIIEKGNRSYHVLLLFVTPPSFMWVGWKPAQCWKSWSPKLSTLWMCFLWWKMNTASLWRAQKKLVSQIKCTHAHTHIFLLFYFPREKGDGLCGIFANLWNHVSIQCLFDEYLPSAFFV